MRNIGAIAYDNSAGEGSFQANQLAHPVAALMSSSNYPATYMPPNKSSVLEGEETSSDDSVSDNLHRTSRFRIPTHKVASVLTRPKDEENAPFFLPHFNWNCVISSKFPTKTISLIDCGCPTVLIHADLVNSLGLKKRRLPKPEAFDVALHNNPKEKKSIILHEWCSIKVSDPASCWHARSICVIIAPSLCSPIILGIPFLAHNTIVIDTAVQSAVDKTCGFNLLNPGPMPTPPTPWMTPRQKRTQFKSDHRDFSKELRSVLGKQ
jgi:hypothetical protein